MADSAAISDVSRTLQSVLTAAFGTLLPTPSPIAEIHDLRDTVSTVPARLTLFLFEVVEDATLRNRQPVRSIPDPQSIWTLERPPVSLVLRYLMTPWSGDPLTDHRLLGRTLQVLHDGAILSGPQLQGSLATSSQAIKLKLAPLTLEESSRIWNAIQRPYRLSLTYDVRVITIDSEVRKETAPVRSRTLVSSTGVVAP